MVERSYRSGIPVDTIGCGYFWWPSMNDQFFTILKVKFFEIPYFEVKYCYKLLNKDICMLFNIPKQLKLVEIE